MLDWIKHIFTRSKKGPTEMADRDQRLGPYGLYDANKVVQIGLKKAIEDTIRHLENMNPNTKEKAYEVQSEVARLKVLLRATH